MEFSYEEWVVRTIVGTQHAASASGLAEQKCHIFMCLRHYYWDILRADAACCDPLRLPRLSGESNLQRGWTFLRNHFDTSSYSKNWPILRESHI